ncbi:hypothetical protein CE91St14_18540 [Porphyromonas somerae]|nr:hypothetical protein CE91St14_18540 [Porphyromonas somerae]
MASWASDSSDLSDLSDSSEKGIPLSEKGTPSSEKVPPLIKPLNLGSTDAVSKVFSRFVGKLKIRVKAKLDETI